MQRRRPGLQLNPIDLSVVIVVVLLGYGLFIGQRVLSGKWRQAPPETAQRIPGVVVRVEAMLHNLDQEVLGRIHAGEEIRDAAGRVIGKIVKTGQPHPDVMELIVEAKAVHPYHPTKQAIPVIMDLIGEARGGTYFFQRQLISVGSEVQLQMSGYEVSSGIIRMLWHGTEDMNDGIATLPTLLAHAVPVSVTFLLQDVSTEEEQMISVGDRMIHSSGVVMAKITAKRWVTDTEKIVEDQTPQRSWLMIPRALREKSVRPLFIGEQPKKRTQPHDLQLQVELTCIQGVDSLELPFFGAIQPGQQLTLQFPDYTLTGVITALDESAKPMAMMTKR